MARVIEDVTIAPSPLWLQNRLRQVGIKAINNAVDVTNYVMMELGASLCTRLILIYWLVHLVNTDTTPNPSSGRRGQSTIVRAQSQGWRENNGFG